MHKDFYASGFLYHIRSQQILLQQQSSADKPPKWSLLGDNSLKNETAEETFKRILEKTLKFKPSTSAISQIYSYFHSEMKKDHYLCYARVRKLEKFPSNGKITFTWLSLKQVLKLDLPQQTKHDITVGQRVIDSYIRKSLGQQTIE